MRYIVKYTKPGQIEGARVFDIDSDASTDAVQRAALDVAGPKAQITSVEPNDQSPIGERGPVQVNRGAW